MGDRVYIAFQINGHFSTVSAVMEVCEAIIYEGLNNKENPVDTGTELERDLFEALLLKRGEFEVIDYECNYGTCDHLESVLQSFGIAYTFCWDAGGDFPAGRRTFTPERGVDEVEVNSVGAVLPCTEIKAALQEADPMQAIQNLLVNADYAYGHHGPILSASEEVLTYLMRDPVADAAKSEDGLTVERWRNVVASGATALGYVEWKKVTAEESGE